MKKLLPLITLFTAAAVAQPQQARWTEERANTWYRSQPWLVGSNYTPATAINQLEMWQAESFDPKRIDLELGWAAAIGMNTMRVFLHDLVWSKDPKGYSQRIDTFLNICQKHGIRPMFVLFDSVWDPEPALGTQRAPKPGVHNSGWVQGPGAKALMDPSQQGRLEAYVKGVVRAFAKDRRVLAWDIWNEPDNMNDPAYIASEPKNKIELVAAMLPKAFAWARSSGPSQPLTAGLWQGDWSSPEKMNAVHRLMAELSDVISFHDYQDAASFENRVQYLQRYKRPLLCTEYMARGAKSTFEGSLPIAKKYNVAAYNWGLVQGKTQTHLPWDSWKQPYINGREPAVWFHEVFRNDGTPYKPEEIQLIRELTGRAVRKAA